MGVDYSYQLYFHRDKLWPVLQDVARRAYSKEGHDQIEIIFPDEGKLTLPFETSYGISLDKCGRKYRTWEERTQPIYFDEKAYSIQFDTSLNPTSISKLICSKLKKTFVNQEV